MQISLQPARLKCFEQNWELLISHQFYNGFSSGLPEISVVIKKVRSDRSSSVHCMLFNIQVYIPRKYSIYWTNTVDSFIKRQDLPLEVKNFIIFCLLPCFYFGMDLLVPVILTQHAESLCKPNQKAKNFLCPLLDSWEGLPGCSTGYSPCFPSLLVLSTADSTWP